MGRTDINWTQIYSKPFKTTSDTKLRWFQCRLLHRIITTNMFLLKINKAENNLCTVCKGTPETILHLFWECISVQTFCNAFVELINNNCPHIYNLSLDAELIIFGENNIPVTDGIFDLFILLAKFFIYKCKVTDTLPNIKYFKYVLKSRYEIERSIHYGKSLHSKFETKWAMYHNIFIM